MSEAKQVGFRVITPTDSDTFELKSSAIKCAQMLRRRSLAVQVYLVLRYDADEMLYRVRIPRDAR